jgi:hypothetical protein
MFPLVAHIHLSNINSLYWRKWQRHLPCHILKISVNGASMTCTFTSWVIYLPIGCRHLFIRYSEPLLATITATCFLPHSKNEHRQSVNSVSGCIFGDQGIERIFEFIADWFNVLKGKYTRYQRYNTDCKLIDIASCTACRNTLLVAENTILKDTINQLQTMSLIWIYRWTSWATRW